MKLRLPQSGNRSIGWSCVTRSKGVTMGKMNVKVIGSEIFDMPKREREQKIDKDTINALAWMLGDLRAEQERHSSTEREGVCLFCILLPDDVKRNVIFKKSVRYLVLLSETSRGKEIPRGCFVVNSSDNYAFEISEFYVQSRYRRKGLGKRMFNAFLRRFRKDRGSRSARITLSVALWNTAAEAFYRNLGFAECAKLMEMKVKKGKP